VEFGFNNATTKIPQVTVAESHKVELTAARGHMPPLCMVSGLRGPITPRGEYIPCNASITGSQETMKQRAHARLLEYYLCKLTNLE